MFHPKAKNKRRKLVQLYNEQGWRCSYCSGIMLLWGLERDMDYCDPARATLEHLHKRENGGDYDYFNLVVACGGCNHSRNDIEPMEYFVLRQKLLPVWQPLTYPSTEARTKLKEYRARTSGRCQGPYNPFSQQITDLV